MSVNEIDYTPRMVEDEVMVEVGGFFSSLGKLKARVDAAYEKHGDISISGDYLLFHSLLFLVLLFSFPYDINF